MNRVSTLTIVGGLVGLALFATAAVLFISGDAQLERLALLFAMFGVIIPGLIGALRADQAQQQTNGTLDGRIEHAVTAAIKARRSTDHVVLADVAPVEDPPVVSD